GGLVRGCPARRKKIFDERASRAHPLHGRRRREVSKTIFGATLLMLIVPVYSRAQQTPPPPAPPRSVRVPQPVEKTLDNGLHVIVVQKSELPLVSARLFVRTGAEADPSDEAGLADTTASLLMKGTKTRSAEEIALGVEELGATIDSSAAWDMSYVNLSALANKFDEAMGYVADIVLHPTFTKDELDRLRDQNVDALQVALKDPRSLANFVSARVQYGAGPYGHNLGGTPASLATITRDDVIHFHQTWYRPDNAVLVVAGDVTPASVFALADKLFGTWKGIGAMPPRVSASSTAGQPRVVVVDLPDAGQ